MLPKLRRTHLLFEKMPQAKKASQRLWDCFSHNFSLCRSHFSQPNLRSPDLLLLFGRQGGLPLRSLFRLSLASQNSTPTYREDVSLSRFRSACASRLVGWFAELSSTQNLLSKKCSKQERVWNAIPWLFPTCLCGNFCSDSIDCLQPSRATLPAPLLATLVLVSKELGRHFFLSSIQYIGCIFLAKFRPVLPLSW
jgi:hypothetical protein